MALGQMDANDIIQYAGADDTCVAAVPEDGDDGEEAAPAPPQRSLCEVCAELPSKYTCPGCARRTCSLPCSKRHKAESGCTGKRDRLKYVSLQDFDDRQLKSGMRTELRPSEGDVSPCRDVSPFRITHVAMSAP